LRLGDRPFAIRIGDRRLHARQGAADGAAATIATDTATLVAVLWHGRSLNDAIATGSLSIDGDHAAAQQLLDSFSAAGGDLHA
jgi:ubiquinone biosynthesis protein UbiJ